MTDPVESRIEADPVGGTNDAFALRRAAAAAGHLLYLRDEPRDVACLCGMAWTSGSEHLWNHLGWAARQAAGQ